MKLQKALSYFLGLQKSRGPPHFRKPVLNPPVMVGRWGKGSHWARLPPAWAQAVLCQARLGHSPVLATSLQAILPGAVSVPQGTVWLRPVSSSAVRAADVAPRLELRAAGARKQLCGRIGCCHLSPTSERLRACLLLICRTADKRTENSSRHGLCCAREDYVTSSKRQSTQFPDAGPEHD